MEIRHAAAVGQLVMMLCFITLLHRAYPEVILADGLFALALVSLLLAPEQPGRQVQP